MTRSKKLRRRAAAIALLFACGAPAQELGHAEDGSVPAAGSFAGAYRRALAQAAAGELSAAAARLAEAEARFSADVSEQAAKALARTGLEVARDVAAYDLEALVPMILLHHETMEEHSRHRRPWLRHHSVEMVRLLAEFYSREGRSEGSRKMAARWLASLAGHLQASGSPSSFELFERSLALDPDCEPALFGLAAHYEKRGGPYEAALAYLERLHEVTPRDGEARVRLAINLERVGRGEEARELLEAVLTDPEPGWTYSLAAQELARWWFRGGRPDEAVALLEDALRKRPDDQKLHVLLAFLHDRNGAPLEARRLAQRLGAGLASSEPTRGLYNRWPAASLDAARVALHRAAAARQPLLREALAAHGGEG